MPFFTGLASATKRAVGLVARRGRRASMFVGALSALTFLATWVVALQQQTQTLASGWREGAALVAYLRPDVTSERALALTNSLKRIPGVVDAELLSGAETEKRMRVALGEHADLVADLEPGSLPSSIEVVLEPGTRDVLVESVLFKSLSASATVSNVEVVGEWQDRTGQLLQWSRQLGDSAAPLVLALLAFVAFALARATVSQDEDEALVARMLGAPMAFLLLPRMLAALGLSFPAAAAGVLLARGAFTSVSSAATQTWADVFAAPAPGFLSTFDAWALIAGTTAVVVVAACYGSGCRRAQPRVPGSVASCLAALVIATALPGTATAKPLPVPAPDIREQIATELQQQAAVAADTHATVLEKRRDLAKRVRDRLVTSLRLLGGDGGTVPDPARWRQLARRRAFVQWRARLDRRELAILDRELGLLETATARIARDRSAVATIVNPMPLAWPAPGTIARGFGTFAHPTSGATLTRRGLDIEVAPQAKVTAPAPGTVRYAGPIRGLDHGVILDHGQVSTVIAKLRPPTVRAGDTVTVGDVIGAAARQRYYLEVRVAVAPGGTPIDPQPLLAAGVAAPRAPAAKP